MTAVDPTAPVGRPLDLNAVMSGRAPETARAGAAQAGRTGFSFGDFIDVINPLQHIPGVAELYRSVTNDQISDGARKTGNALYGFALGGPVGLGAMLAYNEVGDRLNGAPSSAGPQTMQVAEATPAAGTGEAAEIPVPPRKPGAGPDASPEPVQQKALLGETVATTGLPAAKAPPLAMPVSLSLQTPDSADKAEPDRSEPINGLASSVSYTDLLGTTTAPSPVMPGEDGLSRLATHKSNHLPLDVLKALQVRHAERSASERS
ncbi:hypothetical protein [Roseibium sp.]|uniref:hypothetical protein n=1 Tax=Roseibium sp. TaxID=1936156 RepID=UPI003265FBCF